MPGQQAELLKEPRIRASGTVRRMDNWREIKDRKRSDEQKRNEEAMNGIALIPNPFLGMIDTKEAKEDKEKGGKEEKKRK